jgi:hypothetical protein
MRVVARPHALLDCGVGNSLSISIRQRIRVLLAIPFLHNVAIVAGGTATAQIIAIAFSPIIARLYGPEAFGILGVFMAAFAMITPLSGLTYGVAIVLPASDDEARALLKLSLMIGLVVTILSALVFGGFQVFLRALASVDGITEVVVVSRYGQARAEQLPPCLLQLPAAPGKAAYVRGVLAAAARHRPRFDLLFCGHINMAALAASVAFLLRRPWWLQIHGIDAWDPPPDRLTRAVVARADLVTAVSRHTRRRFLAWANNLEPHQVRVLPNVVDPRFTPGPKPAHLIQRYGLIGKRVLLTVGRLASAERYKGHDRVIAALAGLRPRFSDLVYVVVGNGDDRTGLEALAREFDAADRVLFLGEVPTRSWLLITVWPTSSSC